MIEDFNTCYSQALRIVQEYSTQCKTKGTLDITVEEYRKQLQETLSKHLDYEDSINYLKEVIELMSRQHIDHLEKLLDSAVKTIFFDKEYSIKLEVSEFRNTNSLNICLVEIKDGVEIQTDIKNNGYGIQSVVGFILQTYFIMYHRLEHILFMDEAMSQLSEQYIPYFKQLLDALVKEYNFKFVLVAHDPRLIEIADYSYKVNEGKIV